MSQSLSARTESDDGDDRVIVDASVAAKCSFSVRRNAFDALELLKRYYELHAPDLLFTEVDKVLCKLIRGGILSEDDGFDNHDRISTFPIQSYPSMYSREEAFQVAIGTKRSISDCLYLARGRVTGGPNGYSGS